ncbi:hypothetical protein Y5W_03136 [Alcanivorax sp. 521-1]|uniref:SbsA Ig-like domain-containing protein n=1 Tax=Alloalcanivorax profundimaris TaxID=2735259 RepID=A0ABS0AUN5_9GAMM|nr:Ig-like domain-containing protein [Alloalcanivorax profundimaris]MBF5057842.1 hypothetical protein [Alloalcanivorax profundimaris]
MTIRILNSAAVALSTAVLLSACGGGGDSAGGRAEDPSTQSQGLVYAYPSDNQGEVSTAAPVILRFSASVSAGDAMNGIRLYEGGADGREMTPNVEAVQGEPNNVMIVPADDDPFQPNQQYTVVIDDLRLTNGDTARDRTLQFTTRALHEGPKQLVVTDMDDFNVIRTFPNFDNQTVADGERLAAMDFSSFRFQMSQPVDRGTAVYGESVTLTYGVDNEQVPATLLVDGRYLTVDPEPEHLDPSQNYTLTLTGDLASTYGANLTEERFRFRPLDTSPRGEPTELVQRLTVGGRSKLTGRDVNQVPVNGTLLGEDANVTQARAESVIAELGDATQFPETLPIRLPKGTVLNGDEINPILIGGEVPAGFGSGDVTMTLLSDATGYLMQNPYSDGGESGARMIKLMMDVGIATGEARANGAFTQDLLHIELVGMANIDTDAGVLNVDAVSVVEPDILGQEFGYGLLSFQLQSYEDQNNAPQPLADSSGPMLQSWTLEELESEQNKMGLVKPGDPIVLNFDEPLDPKSVADKVHLWENSSDVEISVRVAGSAIVIEPASPLKFDHELNPVQYQLEVDAGIADISGNEAGGLSRTFSLPLVVDQIIGGVDPSGNTEEMRIRPPVVTATYPGFPCVTDQQTRDLANNVAGRCLGSVYEWTDPNNPDSGIEGTDMIPVMTMPKNRPIIVNFSKNVDTDSVQLGTTFTVQQIDDSGASLGQVEGELVVNPRQITFYPEEDWEDGTLYAYTLHSNGDLHDSSCDPSSAICSGDQPALPLQTQILGEMTVDAYPDADPGFPRLSTDPVDERGGGKDMVNFFRGGPETNDVLQNLANSPTSDTNANFFHDTNHDVEGEMEFPAAAVAEPREYAVEEKEPGAEPDPYADLTESPLNGVPIDLNGVKPIPNSSKVLSRNTAGSQETDGTGGRLPINYGTIGCGVSEAVPFDPNNPFAGNYFVPVNCPDKKFVYLTGALNAEVTDEYSEQRQAIKVKIWPSQIVTTNLTVYTNIFSAEMVYSYSGPQILRIRYAEGADGNRNQPVTGWIRQTQDGPVLDATVDLYLDVPYLEQRFFAVNNRHNLHSYPLTMELSGPLEFLDDGRMVVSQFNYNNIDIDLRGYGVNRGFVNTKIDLRLPDRGTYIKYVTQPIK